MNLNENGEFSVSKNAEGKQSMSNLELIEFMPDAVFIHDIENIVYANDSAVKLIGVDDFKELIGKKLTDFTTINHIEVSGQVFSNLFTNIKGSYMHEGKLRKADGSAIDVEVIVTPFTFENQPTLMITMRDITNRKKAEQLMSKPYIDFVHPDDRERTIAAVQRLKDGKKIVNFENRYLCKDGSYKFLSWNAIPVKEQGLFSDIYNREA